MLKTPTTVQVHTSKHGCGSRAGPSPIEGIFVFEVTEGTLSDPAAVSIETCDTWGSHGRLQRFYRATPIILNVIYIKMI